MEDSNIFWTCKECDDVYIYSKELDKEDKIKLKPQFRYFDKGKLKAIQWRVKDNDGDYKQIMKVLHPKEWKLKRERKVAAD
jgi:hypothetical protein